MQLVQIQSQHESDILKIMRKQEMPVNHVRAWASLWLMLYSKGP